MRSADLARQRSDALRLAQQELESLRNCTSLEGPGNSFAAIGNATRQFQAAERRTRIQHRRCIDQQRGWTTNTAPLLHQDEKRPSHRGS